MAGERGAADGRGAAKPRRRTIGDGEPSCDALDFAGSPEEAEVRREFLALEGRLRGLEARYNTGRDDLHFAALTGVDPDLYTEFLALSLEGLVAVRRHRQYFLRDRYCDDMFWYDLFLMVRAAADGLEDDARSAIPDDVVQELAVILVEMGEFVWARLGERFVPIGEISRRNGEALEGTLYAFYGPALVGLVREQCRSLRWPQAVEYLEEHVRAVERQEPGEGSAAGGARPGKRTARRR